MRYTIKTIWGLAKSPELRLDKDSLYALVYRETKKDSMKKLTNAEIEKVCKALSKMKDYQKPGNQGTMKQRQMIHYLCKELGWNTDEKRLNGFIKKMFNVERLEWLDISQCSKLIEAMKSMAERKEK
ncbi:MAG: regulatory protein GemA [Bacillales bacterium]|nr:regulatory protein GemA [Bacillales bacterium]